MNRFQRLAALTLATALGLVTIGVIVRATGSGMGCPDWPLCHGQLIPPIDDYKAWLEWIHRTVAVIIGFEVLGLAILAWLDDCVELCGTPLELMSDNGSPFVVWMPGVLTLFGKTLEDLRIRHIRTQVNSPWTLTILIS